MKITILCAGFIFCCLSGFSQNNNNNNNGHGNNHKSAISLSYSRSNKNQLFTANPNTANDITKGVAFNNGNAIRFEVSSSASYFINIRATDATAITAHSGSLQNQRGDIRDFIFFKLVENETDGISTLNNSYDGEQLGNSEKTIISNCPATYSKHNYCEDNSKSFSLAFKVKTGYSLPPGTYTTRLLITATHE